MIKNPILMVRDLLISHKIAEEPMTALRIEKPELKKNNLAPRWIILTCLLLAAAAGCLFWLFGLSGGPDNIPGKPFEITNFTGKPEFYMSEKKMWIPAMRNSFLGPDDKIKTGPGEEVDIRMPDLVVLRLQENSILSGARPGRFETKGDKPVYRVYLAQGSLIGATEKGFEEKAVLRVTSPEIVASVHGGLFEVREKSPGNWFGVLKGSAVVGTKSDFSKNPVTLRPLQKYEVKGNKVVASATKVSTEEWDHLKEAYELIHRGAAQEAEQLDLAKKAGNLFEKVFDHGTFYTPKVGYADRNFALNDNGEVTLTIEYDVFPRDSYVGMYMKLRDLDLINYNGLEFEARLAPDTDTLKEMQIEMKSAGSVVRRLAAKTFGKDWKRLSFPLNTGKSTPLSEITFLFSHGKVGEVNKGTVEFRNITIVKNPNPPPPAPAKKTAEPAVKKGGDVVKPEYVIATPNVSTAEPQPLATATKSSPSEKQSVPPAPKSNEDEIPADF
jgi:hypothetical protein